MPFQGKPSMKLVTYEEVLKDSVALNVQRRFGDEIQRLQALGFTEEFYLQETAFPFSALLLFPIVMLMHYKGERVSVGRLLQVISYSPYLTHEHGYAYSIVGKLGVRYVSMFDDGSLLATTTYDTSSSNPDRQFISQYIAVSKFEYEKAWKQHVESVDSLSRKKRSVIMPIGMKDVMRMEKRYNQIIVGLMPDDLKEKRKKNG
jgi:hypothetical protein